MRKDGILHLMGRNYTHADHFPTRSRRSQTGRLSLLYLTGNVCYLLSLHGAPDPDAMDSIQGILGILLIAAVLLMSTQFWLCAGTPLFLRNAALQATTILAWYIYDNGNRLSNHGAYNMLIFFMAAVTINAVVATFKCWWWLARGDEHPRRFCVQIASAFVTTTMFLVTLGQGKETALQYGFLGASGSCGSSAMSCQTCEWARGVPWLDFVPFRLNFWVGGMTCPVDNSFSAALVNHVLEIKDCNSETSVPSYFNGSILHDFITPAYSLLPRTEAWGLPLKHDSLDMEQNAFQTGVLEFVEAHTYPYWGPTILDDSINAVIARCGNAPPKIVRSIGQPAIMKDHDISNSSTATHDGLNVIVIFMDSVSRNHFHRMMPKTRQVIESIIKAQESDVFEMFRYHTVGLNTGPNTRAMWAGLDEHDGHAAGIPIWEQFEKAGYTVGRVDPMCQDWDAYYAPSHLEQVANTTLAEPRISHEYIAWSCLPPYLKLGKNSNGNFDGAYSLTARCISDTHVGWHTLDYARDFVQQYTPEAPFYLHATFMEAHEGSGAVLSTLDAALAAFLDPSQGSVIDYTNTAVVIAADHGALMGLRSVMFENGRVEAASPLGAFLLPRQWSEREGRMQRLLHATGQVVTGFDLYETIRGLGGNALIHDRSPSRRGVDLARETINHRSCADAGISQKACKCIL